MKAQQRHLFWGILFWVFPLFLLGQGPLPFASLNGPEGGTVSSLAVHPDGDVYAAVSASHIYRSPNQGGSWEKVGFSGANPEAIFCSSDGFLFANSSTGVWRSINEGATWSKVNSYITFQFMEAANGTLLIASDWGIIKSTTKGLYWNETDLVGFYVHDWTMSPSGGLYVSGRAWCDQVCRLYFSPDNGLNWEILIHDLAIECFTTLSLSSGTLLLQTNEGLQRSYDEGSTWEILPDPGIEDLWESNGFLLASVCDEGLLLSLDEGATWVPFGTFGGYCVRNLAVTPDYLLAGADHIGVRRYKFEDFSWEEAYANEDMIGTYVDELAASGSGTLYGLLKPCLFHAWSSDNWTTQLLTGGPFNDVFAVGNTVVVAADDYMILSDDEGATWTVDEHFAPIQLITAENGDWYANGKLQVDTEFKPGIFWSSDKGVSWNDITPSLSGTVTFAQLFLSKDGTLFATYFLNNMPHTIRSEDNGVSWNEIGDFLLYRNPKFGENGEGALFFIGKHSINSKTFLWKSVDGGLSWTQLQQLTDFTAIEFEVNAIGHLFVNDGDRIRWSKNEGGTWGYYSPASLVSTGTPRMLLDEEDFLCVSFPYNGVWRTNPSTPVVELPDMEVLPLALVPNPVVDQAVVRFDLSDASAVRLDCYDVQGRWLGLLEAGEFTAGQHEIPVRVESWPEGVYFLRLLADAKIGVVKMIRE